jgi:hypothetical protein
VHIAVSRTSATSLSSSVTYPEILSRALRKSTYNRRLKTGLSTLPIHGHVLPEVAP